MSVYKRVKNKIIIFTETAQVLLETMRNLESGPGLWSIV